MCFYSRRQNTKRAGRRAVDGTEGGGMKEPLLMSSVSNGSDGGSAHPPAEPAEEEAEYDAETGAPANMTAKRDVAREWNSAALSGEKSRVVDLPYAELEAATQGFSEFNMVGGGASCAVFVARVFGVTAAIKQLKDASVEWEAKQFASEMAMLQRASHANICRLLAFSSDGPHRCLVLELCSGGALNERLACKAAAGRVPPAPLTWQERVRIAHGIASALEYLHGLTPQMIHRCVVGV
jgi:serine/threonine protein kinase